MPRLCPICKAAKKTKLYHQNFHNKVIALMENYDVVVCDNCGFVYADNIPSQEEFNKYYAKMSKYEFDFKDGVVASDYREHFEKIVNFLKPYLPDKRVGILDIGCSTGALLNVLKLEGYFNLLGLDPSLACVKTVKKLYGLEAKAGNIFDFKTDRQFGVIILSAVLEHLVNFKVALKKIRSWLVDGGLLFVEVPDAERFDGYIFTPFQQFSIEHLNYFSQSSLKNLLGKFAFETMALEKNENRVNQTIDPDILCLSEKQDKSDFKIVKDDACQLRIKKYIAQCSQLDLKVKKIIRERLSDKNKIIVWGVGTHTQRLIGAGLDLSKILFFVDSNSRYHGKKLNGLEIKSPADIKEGAPILISTYSYQEEVIRQIRDGLKLKNEIVKIYE